MAKKSSTKNLAPLRSAVDIISPSKEMTEQLLKVGMTPENVSKLLMELCNFTTIKIDKNGEVHESIDGKLRMQALELWCKIAGVTGKSSDEVHNHLHLDKLSDGKLDELADKA